MEWSTELQALITSQKGLATRVQLLEGGVTPAALRWHLGRDWRQPLPGVVATFTGALDPGQWLVAGQLFAGPDAMLSSLTAAAWHGVEAARHTATIRLSVPERRAARKCGAVGIARTARPDPRPWQRDALQICSPARAVVDAARDAGGERPSTAIVVEAVPRGIVTVAAVRHELECGQRRGSASARRGVDAAELGAWSVPEVDLLGMLGSSRKLPEVWANPQLRSPSGLRLPTPDAWIDEVGLAVQVHSRSHHLRDADWNGTVAGDSLLGEHGVIVLGVTPGQISADPGAVLARVERAYFTARTRPRPAVIARPLVDLASG